MNVLAPPPREIRVLVVDDSLVIRGLISRHLKDVAGVSVVGSASDGAKALDHVRGGGIDVVILDIEMPVMDGIAALPEMLKIDPALVVIMASTLTTRNAAISLRALRLGAADYIPKPSATSEIYGENDFRRELLEKVLHLGHRRHGAKVAASSSPAQTQGGKIPPAISLRARTAQRPKVLAVASSTGGPNALALFFKNLDKDIALPIFVTQHMPPTFTALLAEHLGRESGWLVKEAAAGDAVLPGRVLIAPGDRHLLVQADGVKIDAGPRENYCRPAADPMLRSLAALYRGQVLSVVLTGMGQDGLKGCEAVVAAGGTVMAQDEGSSVIWGMPGAVATAGLCTVIGTPDDLARAASRFVKTGSY
ncbi:MAG: chemotaxis-specific protein-glutamate methyltransferase CheB [Rhodospirillaceae bacterium]|nr:chemotaxis-specific protein-glutamate methyltransferase CheB [Rhodospirillaceae bacterium]